MLSLSVFHTVEFYVILTVVAAAIVVACAMPSHKTEAKLHLLAGDLYQGASSEPTVEFLCRDDGSVVLVRRGLNDVYASGAVSLAVKVAGFDVEIEERLSQGSFLDTPMTEAMFVLDFFGAEYYHIKYNSSTVGRFAALTLHVRPGIKVVKELKQ